jgi:TPR repeat protein
VERWEVTFRRRAASHAHPQQWSVFGTNMGHRQRHRLVFIGQLYATLVQRLICFKQKKVAVLRPLDHVTRILSQRHIVGSHKNQAECLHQEGWRLYGAQHYSHAAQMWAKAALLHHGHSHARLSSLLLEGREGVARDFKRAFALAKQGAALGCPHSKGKSMLNTTKNQ